jgi:hypothetical protein
MFDRSEDRQMALVTSTPDGESYIVKGERTPGNEVRCCGPLDHTELDLPWGDYELDDTMIWGDSFVVNRVSAKEPDMSHPTGTRTDGRHPVGDLDSSASTLNALREAALARLRPDHRWVSTDRPSKEG